MIFIYIFDLNNLRNLGQVRTLANPLSRKRLENILNDKLALATTEHELESYSVDEVSILYFDEDTCSCSRQSKCVTNKCSYRKKKVNCKPFCHPEATFNCENH